MPAHCAVVNCSDKYLHAGSISFHRFPFKRKDLLQKWQDFTQRTGQWMPSKWSAVCSRHFVDDDFNCSNNRKTLKKNAVPTVRLPEEDAPSVPVKQHVAPTRPANKPTLASAAEATATGVKATCRFCGTSALNCSSFDNNFELFGMIQRCFPTLQILQDDTLPKDICKECCLKLEQFSQFIDVVMQAQSELQRKYRRQLKIKQEPCPVRVKQEACESLDNLFPDELDLGLEQDEGCEHEETEQKFQFCDFPMLNSQDIINNCDIMEIINLDDPFINIPDDADVGGQAERSEPLRTANEMLQSELLTEEHNYAKEEWPLPNLQYKTEKVEGAEVAPEAGPPPPNAPPAMPDTRSCKPIVTNVSQIPNPMLCELLPAPAPVPPPPTSSKPNIVVLNDSVVQSSDAFRLHSCSLCTAKFITLESLNQHFALSHNSTPMVSVPVNLPLNPALKLEGNTQGFMATEPLDYWQPEWQNSPPVTGLQQQQQQQPKKKIDILDMQSSFLHHKDLIPATQLAATALPLPDPQLAVVSANYAKLADRYRKLKLKCKKLNPPKRRHGHTCRVCQRSFPSFKQLFQHRRFKGHFVKVKPSFLGRCSGCLKLFRSRRGLRQHMKYICQSLSLKNHQRRLQSFKCRHCQAIAFAHWRLYRRHELNCPKRKPEKTKTHMSSASSSSRAVKKKQSFSCSICKKSFGSLNGLKQHDITHSTERQHKCGICDRVFKRRNGLSQHIKGYHLQLKPHECPVCEHRYALKCDMLRCRHSLRKDPMLTGSERKQ
ncbi:uncharacterized protein [Drosophila kikkawai]|uniref:Uncharacterized protein n=1 Tax=Drosophila kikkawai TaxID=30033 RepID=A0A6P4IM12_DROKI|nr:uncharacterized protein LOC108079620 [Drosophila kikkawai]